MRNPLVQRGLIALVLVLAMAVWFSASAVVPALAGQWHLSAGAAAWMTAPVQAGFVLGPKQAVAVKLPTVRETVPESVTGLDVDMSRLTIAEPFQRSS